MLRLYLVTAMFVALAACQASPPGNQPGEPSATGVARTSIDGIMLVFVREFSFTPAVDDIADEDLVIACTGETIRLNRPQQRIIAFDEFRRAAFPNLSRDAAPRTPKYLSMLLQRKDFRDRIRPLGIRHIAFIGGVTKTIQRGGMAVVGGPHAAGIFGVITWDKKSRLGASVLDLNQPPATQSQATQPQATTDLKAAASGMAWLAIVGVIPFGLPSDTVGTVCRDLGTRLAAYLDGKIPDGKNPR